MTAESGNSPCWPRYSDSSDVRGKPSRMKPVDLKESNSIKSQNSIILVIYYHHQVNYLSYFVLTKFNTMLYCTLHSNAKIFCEYEITWVNNKLKFIIYAFIGILQSLALNWHQFKWLMQVTSPMHWVSILFLTKPFKYFQPLKIGHTVQKHRLKDVYSCFFCFFLSNDIIKLINLNQFIIVFPFF